MKKILFALSAFALVLTSCGKDDEDKSEVTMENVAGTYKVQSATVQMGTGGPTMDIVAQMDACERDDTQTLNVNGTYTTADAGTQCNPPTPPDSGTWSLPSTTTITMDGETYTITSFDGDKLSVSQTYTDQGITYTVNMTLDKQ